MEQNHVNLVLLRHGQSLWNLENKFTGWVDVNLSAQGESEALRAALKLKSLDLKIDFCFSSILKRAIHTLWILQKELNLEWLPWEKSWRLNERHYGALQGLNKKETEEKYGSDQVKIWRRSYDTPPPFFKDKTLYSSAEVHKYTELGLTDLPLGESLKMCKERTLPYYIEKIKPLLQSKKNVLVVAHGNSLRSLMMDIESISGTDIMSVELETAVPVIYTLDVKTLKVIHKI